MSFAKAAAHPPVASAEIVHTHATSTTFDKNGKVVKVVEEEENIDIGKAVIVMHIGERHVGDGGGEEDAYDDR